MRKFLLFIILMIIVVAVVIFSIPFFRNLILNRNLRNQAISMMQPGSAPGQTAYQEEVHQPSAKNLKEPGIERIKSDLIGKQIPGWSFDKLSEFKHAAITSIARTDTRIDFRLDLRLLSYNARDETLYDAQVFAIYIMGEDGWQLDKLEEIFIAFDVTIPPGRWVTIASVPGCSLHPDIRNNLVWTTKTWDYEIISGPSAGDIALPEAKSYDVKAKGKHPVKIRLTFRPGTE
ncbi:MAG: hypothetical protein NTW31_01805 [Bacteroidetes bacterium]|nr:hypothetical protein [Bacteroidota bacterium]